MPVESSDLKLQWAQSFSDYIGAFKRRFEIERLKGLYVKLQNSALSESKADVVQMFQLGADLDYMYESALTEERRLAVGSCESRILFCESFLASTERESADGSELVLKTNPATALVGGGATATCCDSVRDLMACMGAIEEPECVSAKAPIELSDEDAERARNMPLRSGKEHDFQRTVPSGTAS